MSKIINEKAAAKQTERTGLAALLTHNEFIAEVMAIFKAEYFNWREHGTLYTTIVSIFQDKGSVDETLLILKLDQIGLKEINGLDMQEYVRSLRSSPTNKDHILDYFREIYKMHTCRKAFAALGQAQNYINSSLDKPLSEILGEVQKITVDSVTANIEERVKLTKIYDQLPNFLAERANKEELIGVDTGYKIFDSYYGGALFGGVYVFAAPAKVGKSTFLNYLGYQMCSIKKNKLRVLILDTELETKFAMSRAVSSLTGIDEFEFLAGDFARNAGYAAKTKEVLNTLDPYIKDRVTHSYIANLGIEEVLSVARRWYVNEVKPGESALIIYDYIKLSGGESQLSDHWKEYQEIGEKTDKLKKFVTSLERAVLFTSVQTNAQGNIAMSKQIEWFANNVYILKRKTLEEIQEDGPNNGTHKLVEVVTRNLGRGAGDNRYFSFKTEDGRINYIENYINFEFAKFRVSEINTKKDVCMQRAAQLRTDSGDKADVGF